MLHLLYATISFTPPPPSSCNAQKKLLNFLGLKRKRRDDTLQMTLTSSSSSLTIPDMLNSFDQWGGFLFTNDATSETISNTPSKKSIFFLLQNILLYFFLCVTSSSRERKREERRGGMRKADLNKLVKAGHLTYFSSFFLLCFAIGPSPTVRFSNFFYFILFFDWWRLRRQD